MEGCVIGGHKFTNGLVVQFDTWSLHHDKELWGDDVEEFKPERFLASETLPEYWIPFGTGPRECIGRRFALMEEKIIAFKLLLKFEVRIADDWKNPELRLSLRNTEDHVFPICLQADEILPASSDTFSKSAQALHIGVLPTTIGASFKIKLYENGSIPVFDYSTVLSTSEDPISNTLSLLTCYLRLEACPRCNIQIEYEPPSHFLNDSEIDQVLACSEVGPIFQPCFSLEFIEERGDRSIGLFNSLETDVYSRSSLRSTPNHWLTTTGNSLLVIARMRNSLQNGQLSAYMEKLFPITGHVMDNTQVIIGAPSKSIFAPNQLPSIGYIQSPRYPDAYPRNIVKNYTLVNQNAEGFVRLVFEDFRVHFKSLLKIFDTDEKLLFDTKDDYRRPPALLSKGNKLTMIFESNNFVQEVGFRARYEFVDTEEWLDRPADLHCDAYLEGYGGGITLEGHDYLKDNYIDCMWLVGRFPTLSRTYDRISLRVEEFNLKGTNLRLEVRRGPTSTSERVLLIFDEQSKARLEHKQPVGGFVTEDRTQPAFYIRLRGYLTSISGLNIVYAQYYRWATATCPGGEDEFHCDNSKCIKKFLVCDGHDHCGDDSDEVCQQHEFSYDNRHVDVGSFLTLVISAVGIIVTLLVIVAILSRIYRGRFSPTLIRSRSPRHRENGPTAAQEASYQNELSPSIQTVGDRRFYVIPERHVSVIEAPPTYDDALKHPVARTSPRRSDYQNTAFDESQAEEEEFMEIELNRSPEPPMPPHKPKNLCSPTRSCRDAQQEPHSSSQAENVTLEIAQNSNSPFITDETVEIEHSHSEDPPRSEEIEVEVHSHPPSIHTSEIPRDHDQLYVNTIETWV